MVVNNFNIFRATRGPTKADAKLFVDSNTMLPFTIMRKSFKHVSGRYLQVVETACSLKLAKLTQSNPLKVHELPDSRTAHKLFRMLTFERNDHAEIVTPLNNNVKRY